MNKLLVKVDASALKDSSCMLRFYRTVVEGWREKLNSNDMEYGSAVHQFIATMKRTDGNFAIAVQETQKRWRVPMFVKPKKQYMTENHLLRTCMDFWQTWQAKDQFQTLVSNGQVLVEQHFDWPYYEDEEMAIMISGTADDICKHQQGTHAIRDYKTTSSFDSVQYLEGYQLSCQLRVYRLVVRWYAKKYPDSVWAEMDKKGVCCFIDGIFIRGKDAPVEFERSYMFQFKDWELEEFEELLHEKVMALRDMIHTKLMFPKHTFARDGIITDSCSTKYGPCKFAKVCGMPDAESAQMFLTNNFIQKPYDPVKF